MEDILHNISSNTGSLVMFLIFGVGGVLGGIIAIIGIIFGSVKGMNERTELEKSRREIAAYIAEGSMNTEDGERLLNAGGNKKSKKRA